MDLAFTLAKKTWPELLDGYTNKMTHHEVLIFSFNLALF